MVNIIKQELEIEESLRKKIEFICEFSNIKPIFKNGCIRKIDKTNLVYIEPHSITIKNINFLFFNYSNDIFINNLSNKIKVFELENYIKTNQDYCYQFKYYNTNINMYSYLAIEYISEVYISEYKNK